MAGAPRKRAMMTELERRAKDFDESTVVEYVHNWVASGGTLAGLADDVCKRLKKGDNYVTRYMVSSYVNGLPGGKEMLQAARREGAHGLADSGIKIVDDAEDGSKEEIAAARVRADFRLRMAGHWNKAEYAPQGNNVNVNVNNWGQQHLDALRRRSVQGRVETPAALPDGTPDVEVVSDGE